MRNQRILLIVMSLFILWIVSEPACSPTSPSEQSLGEIGKEHRSFELVVDGGKERLLESVLEQQVDDVLPDILLELDSEPSKELIADDSRTQTEFVEPVKESFVEPQDVSEKQVKESSHEFSSEGKLDEQKPDISTSCRNVGEVLKQGESCCAGLVGEEFYADSLCMPPAMLKICMACGDGRCDWSKGEDRCSCPKDCRQTVPSGTCVPKKTFDFVCPDGKKVPWCSCSGKVGCMPVCKFIGTRSEGWYDSCSSKRFRYEFCSKCKKTPVCDKIGTKSEGWYCDGKLITWAMCSNVQSHWSCIKSPENGCSRCKMDSDCKKFSSCTQLGTSCVEWHGACGQFNLCGRKKKWFKNRKCETVSGRCM